MQFLEEIKNNKTTQKYTLIEEEKSWIMARQHCRDQHTDLATIFSQEKNEEVKSYVEKSQSDVWIGLFNEPWEWSDGGQSDFKNWSLGQPIKYYNRCVAINQTGWYDLECNLTLFFLCNDRNFFTWRYKLVNEPKPWAEARAHCIENITELVKIEDQSENGIVRMTAMGKEVWIGLKKYALKWSDGAAVTFFHLFRNQSEYDYYNQKCVYDNRQDWVYSNCSSEFPFFCYTDIKNITLVKLNKTWEEALDYCRSHHTDLISSTSAVDQYLILKEAEGAQSSYVWLGLRLSLISGSWFWVNREPMVYNNGMQGGHDKCPDSNYCGAMSTEDGIWTNSSCGERMNFICYTGTAPQTQPPATTTKATWAAFNSELKEYVVLDLQTITLKIICYMGEDESYEAGVSSVS
ncbi:MRC2 protein, partial [Amia calva]|nr:MRC2 protein [Amia calva]